MVNLDNNLNEFDVDFWFNWKKFFNYNLTFLKIKNYYFFFIFIFTYHYKNNSKIFCGL